MQDNNFLVYSQKDMQLVLDFVDSLQFTGIATARRVSSIATILEAGKPLDNCMKGESENGIQQELHANNLEG